MLLLDSCLRRKSVGSKRKMNSQRNRTRVLIDIGTILNRRKEVVTVYTSASASGLTSPSASIIVMPVTMPKLIVNPYRPVL